jgi:hypothetical protein
MSEYVDCPKCGSGRVQKVAFTWWGGVLGPALLNHVQCQECRATFNGETGQSNNGPILIYSLVVGALAVGMLFLLRSV